MTKELPLVKDLIKNPIIIKNIGNHEKLKITELKKEHIGQIGAYMNYIDKNIKVIDEDKTIGIIIVKSNDRFVMEYCSDDRIFSKEYKLVSD